MTITEHVAKLLLSLTVTRRKLFENFNLKNHAAEYLSIKIIYSPQKSRETIPLSHSILASFHLSALTTRNV